MRYFLIPLLVWYCGTAWAQNTTISGNVKDEANGEAMIFATVYVNGTTQGTTTNEYGFYSITVSNEHAKNDSLEIVFSFIGYTPKIKRVSIQQSEHQLNASIDVTAQELKTFEVVASKSKQQEELNSTQMSIIRMPISEVAYIPTLGGETDVIKVMQLMPGVAQGGEGGTGMFVRGGDADQNLVLLDEATVYNIGHLFGFFSVFNPDAIKDMTMIKGAFPSNYGGRLSSILDIRMKEGHDKKIHGQGGIGLLSSRATIEGPITNKSSFLLSGRRTYIDKVFKTVNIFIPYYFYDVNAKVNYKFSDRDRLYVSTYIGDDVLKFTGDDIEEDSSELGFGFNLGNITNTIRWNRVYNPKLFSNISFIHTRFKYDIRGKFDQNNVLIRSNVRDLGVKAAFDYYKSSSNHIRFGFEAINHNFKPNVVSTAGEITDFLASSEGEKLLTQELALYGQSDFNAVGEVLKVNTGLRLSGANVKGEFYMGLEPRVSARYSLSEFDALKLSYSVMRQYMHRVSSSSVALPTDLWYPVTNGVKPQTSNQVALGYHRVFDRVKTSLSVEGYYKTMTNLTEYKEGANLILNDNFEEELLQGKGESYGAEVLLRKEDGKFTGWIGYTLSWTTRQFDELNKGKTYFAKYDRRHNISLVATYKLSKRWTVSTVWVYATGSRFTAQVGQYFVPNASLTGVETIPIYTERNAVAMSPSHRWDINFILGPKKERKFRSEWHFGGYNLYNRSTPYRVEVVPRDEAVGYKYQQPGLFGFIPSIAYNFKF